MIGDNSDDWIAAPTSYIDDPERALEDLYAEDIRMTPAQKHFRAKVRNDARAALALSGLRGTQAAHNHTHSLRHEILDLARRGKDHGRIAIWTGVKLSVVEQIISEGRVGI